MPSPTYIFGIILVSYGFHTVYAPISGDVRLMGGRGAFEGRLEVFHRGSWRGVCDDVFDLNINAAVVVCRQLGFPTNSPEFHSINGGNIFWLDEVLCTGRESKITLCGSNAWGNEDCSQSENVWITCNGDCNINNGGCSHVCVYIANSHYCECPDVELQLSADNHTCHAPGVQVRCSSQGMVVEFSKNDFPGLHAQYLTMNDTTCRAKDTPSGAHIYIEAPLDGCGTRLHVDGDDFVYTNQILARQVSVHGLVSHVRDISMDVHCRYSKFSLVRNLYLVSTGELNLYTRNHGNYNVSMDFVYNGNEYRPTSSIPLAVKPGEQLSVKLKLYSNDSNLQIFANECKATPTFVANNQVQYLLLENGCAHDTTLTIANITNITEEILTLESFKFLGNLSTVYFHCDVLVCNVSDPNSRCHRGCLRHGTGKRRLQWAGPNGDRVAPNEEEGTGDGWEGPGGKSYLTVHRLSAGPVTIHGSRSRRDIHQDRPQTKSSNSEFLIVAAGVSMLALSVVVTTIALYIHLRR